MKGAIFVLLFDNFYDHRFHPTPHESNTSLNCSAIAVALVSKATEFLWGFPSLPTLQASTAQVGKLFTTNYSVLMPVLFDLTEDKIPPQYTCCLLNVRRTAVHRTQWHPCMLPQVQSGTQSDLLWLVLAVCAIQDHTSRVLPILIDEKIHHSIITIIYSVSYHGYNMGHKLC